MRPMRPIIFVFSFASSLHNVRHALFIYFVVVVVNEKAKTNETIVAKGVNCEDTLTCFIPLVHGAVLIVFN